MVAGPGYTRVQLADLPSLGGVARSEAGAIRHALSSDVSAYTARHSGAVVIAAHDELGSGREALYVVLGGHAEFEVGGESVDAPSGTVVLVRDPVVRRAARALQPGTTVVAVGPDN